MPMESRFSLRRTTSSPSSLQMISDELKYCCKISFLRLPQNLIVNNTAPDSWNAIDNSKSIFHKNVLFSRNVEKILLKKTFRVRDSDPLGRRCGAVARAARACRRCARGALLYSPTAHICAGTPILFPLGTVITVLFKAGRGQSLRFCPQKLY